LRTKILPESKVEPTLTDDECVSRLSIGNSNIREQFSAQAPVPPNGSALKICYWEVLRVKENVMSTMLKEDVLKMARISGARAPVIAVPDPTADGFRDWKKDLLVYFGCAADNLIHEYGAGDELRGEILSAMKDGFKELILSQPYVEVSESQPKEDETKMIELRILDEVFEEFPDYPHHCTR
jgi:hypothetical protein